MGRKEITLKGFKITDTERKRLCGVACKNFEELIHKGCSKLKLDESQDVTVHLQDGTVIDSDSYLSTVAPQTVLIFAKRGETITTGADLIYNALKLVNLEVLEAGEAISQFFDEDIKAKVHVLSKLLNESPESDDNLILASSKEEHPDWFIGIDSNSKTKEEFLKKRCQDRIKSYFYKSISDLRSSRVYKEDGKSKKALEDIIKQLKEKLSKNRYCGVYFVRSSSDALCNRLGDFTCSGVWYKEKCAYNGGDGHKINPYRSRDHRIIFSTWNLDHRIERSRTIIPTVIDLISNGFSVLNCTYLFELLFTTKNLRLVHIVCHDKSAHLTAKCDLKEMVRI